MFVPVRPIASRMWWTSKRPRLDLARVRGAVDGNRDLHGGTPQNSIVPSGRPIMPHHERTCARELALSVSQPAAGARAVVRSTIRSCRVAVTTSPCRSSSEPVASGVGNTMPATAQRPLRSAAHPRLRRDEAHEEQHAIGSEHPGDFGHCRIEVAELVQRSADDDGVGGVVEEREPLGEGAGGRDRDAVP